MLLLFLLCRPLKRNWATQEPARCVAVEETPLLEIHLATNFFSDLILISIPIFTVHSLRLPKAERYAIATILVIGCVAPAMALNRFVIMVELLDGIGTSQFRTRLSCSILEAMLADTAFFLPAVRVYYRKLCEDGGLFGIFASSSGGQRTAGISRTIDITVHYANREETGSTSDTELTRWKPAWDKRERTTEEEVESVPA